MPTPISLAEASKFRQDQDSRKEFLFMANERIRNFATLVYPESAPADWLDRLDSYHVAYLVSPLHDKDTNPDGELKKPHYHVMLMFEGKKSFEQVKPIFDDIGAVGRENVQSARGYARYLCHLDNAEKASYSPSDVRFGGGADYHSLIQSPGDETALLSEIMAYAKERKIYSFAELLDLARTHHSDWYRLVTTSKGWIVREYIKSLAWERMSDYTRKTDRPEVDPDTGEVH